MTQPDPLDRIEMWANYSTLGSQYVQSQDVLALVEVARAARDAARKLKSEYDRLSKRDGHSPPEDESWAEGERLTEALAPLET